VEGKPGSRLSGVQPTLGRPRTLAVAALVAYGVYAALMAQYVPWSSFAVLRPGEVEALDWIDNAVPVSGEFLVISGRTAWGSDPLSEWFPALTHHVSLATPQGKEWTGGLADATARHRTLQLCSQLGLACLEEWVTEGDTHFDFVLVAKYPASSAIQTVALIEGIGRSQEYEMVYTNPDAAVFSHRFTQTP